MAISLVRTGGNVKQNYNASYTIDTGGAPAVGDVVAIEFGCRITTITPPAGGWLLGIGFGVATGALVRVWYKVVVGGEAGDTDGKYTFTGAGDYLSWTYRVLHSSVACSWVVERAYSIEQVSAVATKQLFPGTTTDPDEYVLMQAMFRTNNVSALTFTLPDATLVAVRYNLAPGADQQLWSADRILSATKDLGTSAGTHTTVGWTTNGHGAFGCISFAAVSAGAQTGSYGPAIEDETAGAFLTSGGFWTAGPAGDYTASAEVDPFNVIPEARDDNNVLAKTMHVGGVIGVDLPDLVVSSVDLQGLDAGGNAVVGTELTPVAHVENLGAGATPAGVAIRVTFYLNNPTPGTHAPAAVIGWSDTYTASLPAFGSVALPMTGSVAGKATFTCPGTLGDNFVQAWVDGVGIIAEADETNNWSPNDGFWVIDAPIIPPNGGGTRPGTRNAQDWMFAQNDPFNTPIGEGATVDAAAGNGYVSGNFINQSSWGTHVWGGNAPETNTADTPTTAGEGHVCVIGACASGGHLNDRNFARDYYQYWNQAQKWWADINLKGPGINLPANAIAKAAGWWGGSTVAGYANAAGLLRYRDLAQGYIGHCLAAVLGPGQLKLGFIAPAIAQDSDATSSDPLKKYVGQYPMGSLLFIPWGVAEPGGLSVIGKMVFQNQRRFGTYVYDRGPGPKWKMDPNCLKFTASDGQTMQQFINSGQMGTITNLLRRVSNNSPANWGGPGARRELLAPPFA